MKVLPPDRLCGVCARWRAEISAEVRHMENQYRHYGRIPKRDRLERMQRFFQGHRMEAHVENCGGDA